MPYVMLQGIRKKAKQRQEQREAMEAEAGLVTGTRKSERRKSGQASRKRSGGDGRASRTRSDRGGARCVQSHIVKQTSPKNEGAPYSRTLYL